MSDAEYEYVEVEEGEEEEGADYEYVYDEGGEVEEEDTPLLSANGCTIPVSEFSSFDVAGYSYDFVLVFPAEEPITSDQPAGGASWKREDIYGKLKAANLDVYSYYSSDKKMIICKIRASVPVLCKAADESSIMLLLDEETLKHRAEEGYADPETGTQVIEPIFIAHDKNMTRLRPYECIYTKLEQSRWPLFRRANGLNHPFSSTLRIKLIISILQSKIGCSLNFAQLMADGSLLGYYPLRDVDLQKLLQEKWLAWHVPSWNQPLHDIRDYFGEKIALYFCFLSHYTSWLLPVALYGLFIYIDMLIKASTYKLPLSQVMLHYDAIPIFCIVMCLWAQFLIVYWKRKEKTMAMYWGMQDYERLEQDRVEFIGDEIKSIIHGKPIKYFDPLWRFGRQTCSFFVLSIMVIIVCVFVTMVIAVRLEYGTTLSAIINAIGITILNRSYFTVAISMTNFENHRTDTEFQDSLISKLFVFQFINSYAGFYFIIFGELMLGKDLCDGSCISLLGTQLIFLFLSRVTVDNILEVGLPYYTTMIRLKAVEERLKSPESKQLQSNDATVKVNTAENAGKKKKKKKAKAAVEGSPEVPTDGKKKKKKKKADASDSEAEIANPILPSKMGSVGDMNLDVPAEETLPFKTFPAMELVISTPEREFYMSEYDVTLGVLSDYSECAVQFGYVVLFVAAFPLAPLFAYLSNIVEIRLDGMKLLWGGRRPIPSGAQDIGTWMIVLELIAVIAVISNAAIVCFAMDIITTRPGVRTWVFILIQYLIMFVMFIVNYAIPREPAENIIQNDRASFIIERIVNRIPDEDVMIDKRSSSFLTTKIYDFDNDLVPPNGNVEVPS